MVSKNEIKYIQTLYQKKFRDKEGLFIAEGPKLAAELLDSEFELVNIYATEEWQPPFQPDIAVKQITKAELERISQLQTPNQVVVVAKQMARDEEPVAAESLTLVLDGIQDPGNFGTIIRTADWFGIKQIVCSIDTADLYNIKVVQSTMGSICRVKVWYKNLEFFLDENKLPVYGALLEGDSLFQQKPVRNGILMIGNESKGIRPHLKLFVTQPVTIPRIGDAESLNAAVATGIILSQLTR